MLKGDAPTRNDLIVSDQRGVAGSQTRLQRVVLRLRQWVLAADKCHQRVPDDRLLLQVDRHDVIRPRGLSGRAVAEVVKRACSRAGVDPATYSGPSLRAGS